MSSYERSLEPVKDARGRPDGSVRLCIIGLARLGCSHSYVRVAVKWAAFANVGSGRQATSASSPKRLRLSKSKKQIPFPTRQGV